MSDTLASLSVEFFGDFSLLNRDMDRAIAAGEQQGLRLGEAFSRGVSRHVGGIGGEVQRHLGGAGMNGGLLLGLGVGLASFASKSAAELGVYRRQLLGISGDAKTAAKAFESLQKTANDSNFDVPQVMAIGTRIAGRTGDVTGAAKETQSIVDAASTFRVRNQDFFEWQKNLGQIMNMGERKVHVVDINQMLNRAPLTTTAIAKTLGVSAPEADAKIRSATGNELTRIIRMVGEQNKGAAARESASDPYMVGANIKDSIKTGIAPTGDLINQGLLPLTIWAKEGADALGQLNKATGGGAGLVAIVSLATAGTFKLVGSLIAGKRALDQAATSLERLTIAAETLSRVQTPSGGLTTIVPGGRGGALIPIGSGAAATAGEAAVAGAKAVSTGAKMLSVGMRILEFAGPGLLSLGFEIGGQKMSESKNLTMHRLGETLKGVGVGGGIGAAIGGLAAGPLGVAIGGAAGAIIGGAYGMISTKYSETHKPKDVTADQTKAVRENTEALKTVTSKGFGGGGRTQRGSLEAELFLMRGVI